MKHTKGVAPKRAAAGITALALAFTGLAAGAVQAADSSLEYGNIDENRKGTLRIHKFETGSLTEQVNPTKDSSAGDKLQNVPFKLFPINLDLKTPEAWATLSQIGSVPADACQIDGQANWGAFTNVTLEAGTSAPLEIQTNNEGVAEKGEIPLGAYLVCEQDAPNALNKDGVKVVVERKAAPFIVTLPRPDKDGVTDSSTGWNYEVNAYPKNTVVEAPKKSSELLSYGAQTADGMEYTITAKVPNLLTGQHFKVFSVIDQMPKELSDAKVISVMVDQTVLDVNNQYAVDYQQPQDFLAVNFTKTGLELLKTMPNKTVTVKIRAKVNFEADTSKIENTGYLFVDTDNTPAPTDPVTPVNPGGPGQPPTVPNQDPGHPGIQSSNKSASTWGNLVLKKYDAAKTDKSALLKGAEFEVYLPQDEQACMTAAANPNFADKVAAIDAASGPISVGSETKFVTGEQGTLTVNGLFIDKADAVGDAEPAPKTEKCYVVKETKAPAGYVLPAENQRSYAVMVKQGTTQDTDIDIPNTKVTVPDLPLTGASGRIMLTVGGIALVAAAFGMVIVSRRRKAENGVAN